ncbi:hypothetical protein Bca52824_002479 [Brassica carinata]|uniref:DUF4283 domain-containing protein n=1 Tax=Brassica carinata TaxID=52824 RepID=A0A8X8BAK5_BRACI|nr:hypothetical protein Bca52824_002479 [Brassica carinata]
MAGRYSEAEKGKKQVCEDSNTKIKRIKAPSLDTSALVKDNELTLLGRLTNPREQRIWALIPGLPRKWNLQGRAEGSDLGNSCFQFRFEKEDDMRRVLDNGPYQFDRWMVILQKWEPVISASFPSLIPLWIRIKGLPLHYWHDDMVRRVGEELGHLVTHELKRTVARVRVLIDGLKPLVKESIVEFDSGEESTITLEYEKLEMHCSFCYSLLHARKNCPQKYEEERTRSGEGHLNQEEDSHVRNVSQYQHTAPTRVASRPLNEKPRSGIAAPGTLSQGKSGLSPSAPNPVFHERVDRHGNTFGDRVGTKQTRNPPPPKGKSAAVVTSSKENEIASKGQEKSYETPQYSKHRDHNSGRYLQRGRDLFPRRSEGQWRPKQILEADAQAGNASSQPKSGQMEPVDPVVEQIELGNHQGLPKDAVMEQLHEVTRQYLSCPDPVEAAVRRQRVL